MARHTKTYRFTHLFYDDSAFVDCNVGTELGRNSRTVTVELDVAAYMDLHSRAVYYTTLRGDDLRDNRGIVASAKATLRRLEEDPFDDDEIAVEAERQRAEWEAGAERRKAEALLFREQLSRWEAERQAEMAAQPTCTAEYRDRKSTRLNSSHVSESRMPSSA